MDLAHEFSETIFRRATMAGVSILVLMDLAHEFSTNKAILKYQVSILVLMDLAHE